MPKPLTTYLLACALVATCFGCELERGESDVADQQRVDVGVDAGSLGDVGLGVGPGAGTMTGTWLLYHERSTCVAGQEQLTHAAYVVDMHQQGATVVEDRQLCRADLTPMFGMQVRIPDAVYEGIEFVPVDRGLVSTLRVGGTYVSATEVGLWGLEMDDPLVDSMPDEAEDVRVVDGDDDGQPGVTFVVGASCERYQSQRQIIKYRGSFSAPNQIDGRSTGVTDIAVFGGSDDLCAIAPAVRSNDAHSRFRMVRVDGRGGSFDADADADGRISCDEALAVSHRVLDEREVDHDNCGR